MVERRSPVHPLEISHDEFPDESDTWPKDKILAYAYPDETSQWRIGVIRHVFEDAHDISAISTILDSPFNISITRNMARTVMTKEALLAMPDEIKSTIESIIPLKESGNADLADCYQVIFCKNDKSRMTDPEIMAQEIVDAENVFIEGNKTFYAADQSEIPKTDLEIVRLTGKSPQSIIDQFSEIQGTTFGETPDFVEDNINDRTQIHLVAVKLVDGVQTVIGTVYAYEDTDMLVRNGKKIKLKGFEIQGARVLEGYHGNQVYEKLQIELLKQIARRKQVDIVFGYSNAQNLAVLKVAGKVDRSLTSHTAKVLGVPLRPAMQQSYTDGKFVDQIVSYIPGNRLRTLYGPTPRRNSNSS